MKHGTGDDGSFRARRLPSSYRWRDGARDLQRAQDPASRAKRWQAGSGENDFGRPMHFEILWKLTDRSIAFFAAPISVPLTC
jgi:hypothetical protein